MSLNAAVPETDLAVSQCVELPDLAEARRTSGWVWLARTFLVCAAGVLAWYTWGHWGDFQIDSGREIYVPVAILQGKLLFRDLCYIYGPFAPYVGALLFRIFGIHLSVLYFFGIGLTIAAALFTFEISRQFDLDIIPSLVPSIVFLLQAFQSFIFNFVFPYSYAASLASCLGLGCLYFAIRHSRDGRPAQLAIASVLGALVILTKQEFGVACLAILGVEIVARCLIERSGRNLKTNALVCGVGLLPAAGVYGWFVWKLSAKLIFFDNWISTPGTFFMRTFAKHTMPLQGFRFQPGEVLQSLTVLALTFLFWFGIAAANAAAIRRSTAAPRISTLVFILDLLIARTALMGLGVGANMIRVFLTDTLFPDGLFFASGLFALWAGWKLLRDRGFDSALAELILGVYAAVVSVRVMMELKPAFNSYAVFFNTPVFLIFTVLLVRIVRSRSEPLPFSKRGIFVSGMLATQVVLLAILIHPVRDPDAKPFTTDFGTFYTRKDVSILFPQIISFMKSHTRNGRDILVLPEPPSLYVFAQMQAPTRWYSVLPGLVDPEQEQEFIREAASNDVRYVLISNRTFNEYGLQTSEDGSKTFGTGFDETIHGWIAQNFSKIGQFGPQPNSFPFSYVVYVFKRNNLRPREDGVSCQSEASWLGQSSCRF